MGEGESGFRFLSDAEFERLDVKAKALYLVRASQEIEMRQRAMRAQLESLSNQFGEVTRKK
jgi:hypothetical protein